MLGVKDDNVRLMPVGILEGARHVLLLRGFFVGYKTLYGDDSYPLLTDWRSQATVRLHPAFYTQTPNELLGNIHVCPKLAENLRILHFMFKRIHAMPWAFGAIASFSFSTALSRSSPQQSRFLLRGRLIMRGVNH